nr:16S rRNA (adenine(1518)-N(6)/adenine(1519)-N(6))-dimethyltransferase RsmA [Actinopolymorpha pittospori]
MLGPADVRLLVTELGIRPTKQRGQNFVTDANTVRRIVRTAGAGESDVVLEIGPGLGSLTLALLGAGSRVVAVEIDDRLAAALPATVERFAPRQADRLSVVHADAMDVTALPGPAPTTLVANLPYNVAVPVLLNVLERFPSVENGLVMVQLEVAERLAAEPGSKIYGIPSVKAAWYAEVRKTGLVGRAVFWPQPHVDSGLVAFTRRRPPSTTAAREDVFRVIDAAFAQRRKTLRAALSRLVGSPVGAEEVLRAADVDPGARGERLAVEDFARIAERLPAHSGSDPSGSPAHTFEETPPARRAKDRAERKSAP